MLENSNSKEKGVERKNNKRRVVDNNPKQSPFLEPAKIIPSLTKMQSAQP